MEQPTSDTSESFLNIVRQIHMMDYDRKLGQGERERQKERKREKQACFQVLALPLE